jgi:hypothetical protein
MFIFYTSDYETLLMLQLFRSSFSHTDVECVNSLMDGASKQIDTLLMWQETIYLCSLLYFSEIHTIDDWIEEARIDDVHV